MPLMPLPSSSGFTIAPISAREKEGSSGVTQFTFSVSRILPIGASGPDSVGWAVVDLGTASASDFAEGTFPNGVINFSGTEKNKIINIYVIGDTNIEVDEFFTVVLDKTFTSWSYDSYGFPISRSVYSRADGVIINDDSIISVEALSASKLEGNSGAAFFTFLVTRTGSVSESASASWMVVGGGADNTLAATGADFAGELLPSGVVSFAAGQASQAITVSIAGDTQDEGGFNESFTLSLANPAGGMTLGRASAVALIYNDDAPGTGTLAIARASAQKAEGQSGSTAVTFTVTRSGDTTGIAGADWAVTGGGVAGTVATNGADFVGGALPSGLITFVAGQTQATVTVLAAADTIEELNESFTVTLLATQAGVSIATSTATGVILNDDFPPSGILSIAGSQADRGEGANGSTAFTFIVTRGGDTSGPAIANWGVTGGGATSVPPLLRTLSAMHSRLGQ